MSEDNANAGTEIITDTSTATDQTANADPENQVSTPPGEEGVQGGGAVEKPNSEDGKGGGDAVIPDTYEFTVPEGMTVDTELVEIISPVFKDLQLTQEQANKLHGVYVNLIQDRSDKTSKAFSDQQEAWRQELMNDESFGGDKFDENAKAVTEFIDRTAPGDEGKELKDMLKQTGIGNNPHLVRYMHKLSQLMPVGEDAPGGGQPSTVSRASTREERMYPST